MKTYARIVIVMLFLVPLLLAGKPEARPGSGTENGRFARGHVIVKFRDNTTEREKGRARGLVSGCKGQRLKHTGIEKLHLPPGRDEQRAVEILNRDPAVQYAELNRKIELLSSSILLASMSTVVPDDSRFGQQWYLDTVPFEGTFAYASSVFVDVDIDAPEGWAVMAGMFDTNMKTAVGVIDSGCGELGYFDTNNGYITGHVDLPAGSLFANALELPADGDDSPVDVNILPDDANGWDFDDSDNMPADNDPDSAATFHGTLISGIIGAAWDNTVGTAGIGRGQLEILPLKALDFFTITEAVEYAIDLVEDGNPVRVLNMSFKQTGSRDPEGLRDVVKIAESYGIAVVAAAGNGNGDNNDDAFDRVFPAEYTRDPTISNVLAVAATGTTGFLSSFTNYGPGSVQIAAPGEGIVSTSGGTGEYASASGTSFSTPVAGAVLGLVMAAHPGLTSAEAIERVVNGGDYDARLAGLIQSGKRVNLAGALAPFYPYSGLAYLDSTVMISMYADTIGQMYGSIVSASLDPSFSTSSDAAVMFSDLSGAWAVSPIWPGIAQFTLTFGGAAAPVGTYETGPWRVTAIRPFTGQVNIGEETIFTSLLPALEGSVSWSVIDTTVASIDADGVFVGLQEGMTRVVLSIDGEARDYSGWVLVTEAPTSSGGGGGCGTTFPPADDPWGGSTMVVVIGILLFAMRWKWLAALSPKSNEHAPLRITD